MVIELYSHIIHFDEGNSRDPLTERSGSKNDKKEKAESLNLSANLMSQQGAVRESRAVPRARGAGRRKTVENGKKITRYIQ